MTPLTASDPTCQIWRVAKRVEFGWSWLKPRSDLLREAKPLEWHSPKTGERRSLREIATELVPLGYVNGAGRPFAAAQV